MSSGPAPAYPPPTGAPVSFPPPTGPPVQYAAPEQLGAVGSVVGPPTKPTIPLNKLAPEAALRRLELTIVRRLEGFLHGDHLGLLPGPGSETSDARIYVPGEDDVALFRLLPRGNHAQRAVHRVIHAACPSTSS